MFQIKYPPIVWRSSQPAIPKELQPHARRAYFKNGKILVILDYWLWRVKNTKIFEPAKLFYRKFLIR